MAFTRAAILGAGGPTGIHLARELLRRDAQVRVVGRDGERLARTFAGDEVEVVRADILDADRAARAIAGCDLVADCIGLPADRMADHPRVARRIAAAVAGTGARCVQISSFWSYLPVRTLPLREDHPREGGPDYVRWRREAEDILQAAGAAVVQLPDFYGPDVHMSTLQQPLGEAARGETMNWIGGADVPHEYAYVPDAMRTVAELVARPEAYGERWLVPGAGPVTGREVAEMAGAHLGRPVKLRSAAPWLLRVIGLFNASLRQFLPMVPHYARSTTYDATKLRGLLGEVATTPYREGIASTLDWLVA